MLVELRVGEQRYRAVWEVLEGASVTEAYGAALGMLEIGEGPPWPISCRRSLLTSRPETALWLVLVAF